MMVYELTHIFYYDGNDMILSRKSLGFFDSYESAQSAISEYREKPGFCDNPNGFSLRRREIEGEDQDKTFYEVEVYLHSEDYEFEFEVELGLYYDEVMAKEALEIYCSENRKFLTSHQLVTEKIIGKCVIGKKEWIDGFDFEN